MLALGFKAGEAVIIVCNQSGRSCLARIFECHDGHVRIAFDDDANGFTFVRTSILGGDDPRWPAVNPSNTPLPRVRPL